jgi:[ribosomal protein S5]-alanine N-acetyltransferase
LIETPRLRLREPDARDERAVEHLFNDPDVMRHYAQVARPGAGAKWLETVRRVCALHGYGPWTVELRDGTFVGQCGPLAQEIEGEPELEIVCFFERAFWRAGFADEAVRACIVQAFEHIGVQRVIGLIFPQNRPSARLALRCGFRFEREVIKDGATMALYALEKTRGAVSTAP